MRTAQRHGTAVTAHDISNPRFVLGDQTIWGVPPDKRHDDRERVAAIQRTRILEAMVHVVCERGYAGASVTAVSTRAKVSRGTFYELFVTRARCFLTVLDEGRREAEAVISRALARQHSPLDALREALAALLTLFDAEPLRARVWLVESLAAGSWALERRERNIAAITEMIVAHWPVAAGPKSHPLVTAGVMDSLHGLLQTHLMSDSHEPLIALLGQCMRLATAPYLAPSLVARETEKANDVARSLIRDGRPPIRSVSLGAVPGALQDPRAYRARESLLHVAKYPGATNRNVADAIGVAGHAQISKLLARLRDLGLVHKEPGRPGHPNAWSVTATGRQAADALLGTAVVNTSERREHLKTHLDGPSQRT